MPKKKNCRADNTYLIEGGSGDNPKLMGRALSDGRDSLYLEFYLGKMEAVTRQIYIKSGGLQWPCIVNSTTFNIAKIIVGIKSGAYQVLLRSA